MQAWLAAWWQRYRTSPFRNVVSAAAITAALVLGSYGEAHPNQSNDVAAFRAHAVPPLPGAALALVGVACLVLAVRKRYPVTVLIASVAAVVAYSAFTAENGAVLLAPAIALFTVAQEVPARRALVIAAATLVVLMAATAATNPVGPTGGGFFLIPALIAAPLFGGIAVSNRRAYVESIQARAEEQARRAVDEERLRIARELHDVVAHTMATINVQAGVAAHLLADNPTAASEALQTIRQSSKDGLRELRMILNVLRQADEADPTEPTPGLGQLDALVSGACKAGLPTTLRQEGTPVRLTAAVDLAAYRIVQESLTNVIKHAGPATATVDLNWDDGELRIEVTDTGRGLVHVPPGGEGGHGILGMRERASSVGGTLAAGPVSPGGYRVAAVLPADNEDESVAQS